MFLKVITIKGKMHKKYVDYEYDDDVINYTLQLQFSLVFFYLGALGAQFPK